ncbi:hypothetical protein AAIB33_08025 [Microbacterium sp. AZCO]|uniref:hypothetical protein n=1 Tax=Microbacterium sp. AZCO TaxID=3142976 RepID=UPI0031F3421D
MTGDGIMERPSIRELLALQARERAHPTPPAALRDLFADESVSLDAKAMVLSMSWVHSGLWPLRLLPRREWIAMFESVGYLVNALRHEEMRPTEPLVLYRGAVHRYRRGLSWTKYESAARYYTGRFPGRPAHVYQITAEPSWLLAQVWNPFLPETGQFIVNVPKHAALRIIPPAEGAR